jgi:hypothetical protein
MITRNGMIARFPKYLRHQLNGRLEDGEPGKQLVKWLNGLPQVQEVLQLRFGGRPISWSREADRLDEQAHEREMRELKQRANAPIRAALETGSPANVFGDGDKGRLIAAMMSDLNHAFDPGILTNGKPSPPQPVVPIQPDQTRSNPIKPDHTPPPAREASPQAQPDHQDLNLDLAPGTRPNSNQVPPQSTAPNQPNQTQSNRFKPLRPPGKPLRKLP